MGCGPVVRRMAAKSAWRRSAGDMGARGEEDGCWGADVG